MVACLCVCVCVSVCVRVGENFIGVEAAPDYSMVWHNVRTDTSSTWHSPIRLLFYKNSEKVCFVGIRTGFVIFQCISANMCSPCSAYVGLQFTLEECRARILTVAGVASLRYTLTER